MFDIASYLAIFLLCCTVIVAIQYYKYVRKARWEYQEARNAFEDVLLSLNRQFKRESERLEVVAFKTEAAMAKNDGAVQMAREAERKLTALEATLSRQLEESAKLNSSLQSLEAHGHEIQASYTTLSEKVDKLQEQGTRSPDVFGPNLPVLPIRREKAIAQLTETELSVLEMLATEGAKTAPEIKERTELSREHTARLMKKLYESGYLERETGKIPYKYSVKKEMEKFLTKNEPQPSA